MNIIRFPLAKLLEVVSTRRCCEVAAIGSQRGRSEREKLNILVVRSLDGSPKSRVGLFPGRY